MQGLPCAEPKPYGVCKKDKSLLQQSGENLNRANREFVIPNHVCLDCNECNQNASRNLLGFGSYVRKKRLCQMPLSRFNRRREDNLSPTTRLRENRDFISRNELNNPYHPAAMSIDNANVLAE